MKRLILISLLTFISFNSDACINVYYSVDNQGHFHETEDYARPFNETFNYKLIEKHLLETEEKLLEKKTYQLLSDYAVYLMKGGKLDESLQILVVLAHYFPNEYQIAANLGTAYELSGNPDSALVYIKRGLELNPDSHGGSEWVHVKILETKIKQRTEPDYLVRNSVLALTAEQEKDPNICNQLLTQVRERFPFCPGPDSIMASLMVDLGDCYANSVSIEYAKANYEIAQKYYGDNSEETKDKIAEMLRLRSKYQTYTTELVIDGENIKAGNVRYQEMMDDHNNPPYQIEWDKINTDVDSLLSIIGLSQLIPEVQDTSEQAKPVLLNETPVSDASSTWVWYSIAAGVLVFMTLLVFFIRRKK